MLLLAILVPVSSLAIADPAPPTSGPQANALYGSGTCQLVSGPRPLGYVGCSRSSLTTNARRRISGFGAPYNHGKRYQCIAQLYNAPKTYPVARDGSFHFSEEMAQGSHGPRGTLKVSGRFSSPTVVSGTYRYTLGRSGCHDKQRRFRMRFVGTLPG
jgi:hypothetical protein